MMERPFPPCHSSITLEGLILHDHHHPLMKFITPSLRQVEHTQSMKESCHIPKVS